jgi:hypothetical protein
VETDHGKEIQYRYFPVQKVIEPYRPEKITSGIQKKSCNQAEQIDLGEGFYDISRGNLRKENGNEKKGDNNRGDFYQRTPIYRK